MSSPTVSFSHVHFYVDHLEDLTVYKELETTLNDFYSSASGDAVSLAQEWHSQHGVNLPYRPQKRDLVKQLIAGLGFRITAGRYPDNEKVATDTKTLLLTSRDPNGVQFLITASADVDANADGDEHHFYTASNLSRFYTNHAQRQGIAVLAFAVDSVKDIEACYQQLHPKLVSTSTTSYGETKVLEVFAYYNDKEEADKGTILRFVESYKGTLVPLPGLTPIDASFDNNHSQAVYCDHWVSNVFDRTGFLNTLKDTLDFTLKVDFNAGVVAAGEAQIESTVTGNTFTSSGKSGPSKQSALTNQSQVYLPINNSLTDVGHVHGFLKEIGQGIQHIASRVENLLDLVQSANDCRNITGEGFVFLNIPRSYYGILAADLLVSKAGISEAEASSVMDLCHQTDIIAGADGSVDLCLDRDDIRDRLASWSNDKKESIIETIAMSRYINLYSLLKGNISEESYMGIVRNQILVDVQGNDLLYQIFTAPVLQRNAGEEAPFLEFIQRVCSECSDENGCPVKMKPGCGGFGIRNFLTLFLSIEVSKAMLTASTATSLSAKQRAHTMVECLTDQLNESNPILTHISNAMTAEGQCREAMLAAGGDNAGQWQEQLDKASRSKAEGNLRLMECSAKYKERMRQIRQEGSDS